MVTIKGVERGSFAEKAGILPGDQLMSIGGHEIGDILDFRFYETERRLTLALTRAGEAFSVEIQKPQYASLGLEFDSFLMDKQHSCRNKCIFCFIDQNPPGMRPSLYFKDDDDRLSFLFGNYITLTNLTDREIDRILQMHISPINVSVHTMDPELRCKMMNNRFAGESLKYLYRLAEGGIQLNCQLVLCPGINDGPALEYTLEQLFALGEGLASVACVPVGLTRYREGLFPLTAYDRAGAVKTLEIIHRWGEKFSARRGTRTVYASDEFYLLAGQPLPPVEFYEDFPQIENGVGILRNFEDEFSWALEDAGAAGQLHLEKPRKVTVPWGEGPVDFMNTVLDGLRVKCRQLTIELVPVKNDFFGGTVNVTGLLTGQDLLKNLKGRELGDELSISTNMLKADEDIFLDDMTLEQLSRELGVPARRFGSSGLAFLEAALGLPSTQPTGHGYYEAAGNA